MGEATAYRDIDCTKTWVLHGVLNFTRYFFRERYKRKFVIGRHHIEIAKALDRVLRGECTRLIINIAPRYGKTELAVKNFIAMGLAINPQAKFIHLSYSDDLARDNSRGVQDILRDPAYRRLFPNTMPTSVNTRKWFTSGGGGLYAVSSAGQVTGFGAGMVDREEDDTEELMAEVEELSSVNDGTFGGAIVIDDPIKPDDARSDLVRSKVNQKFETTIRNRVNSRKTPIIIIMQRLDEDDLSGYLMKLEPDEWEVLSLPVIYQDEGGNDCALWEFKHTLQELYDLREKNAFVFDTQYMQNPQPVEGLMYEREFTTYDSIPITRRHRVKAYIDTADTGKDFLCCIIYVETETANYIRDVYYTQAPMETTESETARRLTRYEVDECIVESNNGGRGFGRNVQQNCRILGNNKTSFSFFAQTQNKDVRIFSNSNAVQNICIMPQRWDALFPQFHKAVTQYKKEGGNLHDDACFVAGTKIATLHGWKDIEKVKKGDRVITPFGIRRVLNSGCTGEKEIITRFGLTATAGHKIFYSSSFRPLSECGDGAKLNRLNLKELIKWRLKKLLYSTEGHSDLWGREGIISASQKAMRDGGTQKGCTLLFGSFITGGKYRKAFAFTIKTITLSITTLVIWSVFRLGSIFQRTQSKISQTRNTKRGMRNCLKPSEGKQANGTKAKQGANGIQSTPKERDLRTRSVFAKIAERFSFQRLRMPYTVPMIAGASTGRNLQNMRPFVCNAASLSATIRQSQANPIEGFAAFLAQQHTGTITEKARVYNLTVEKDGCYYANGILVSNCDALTGTVEKRASISIDLNRIARMAHR